MLITVDGYAKAGKSDAAERLAAALGLRLLDTGAMYRAAGLALADSGIDLHAEAVNRPRIAAAVAAMSFEMCGTSVTLDGVDYTALCRTDAAGEAASRVAEVTEVRERLKGEQRRIVAGWGGGGVCDGRDQGTAVFPHAAVKFFFTCDIEEKVRRRVKQLADGGKPADPTAIRADLLRRDYRDVTRGADPLYPAADAVPVDTTCRDRDAVLALLLQTVRACG